MDAGAGDDRETAAAALLLGDDYPQLRTLGSADIGGDAAIGLSAGRFPKAQEHVDPNEDAVVGVAGPAGRFLAVADGHHGFDAARGAAVALHATLPRLLEDVEADPSQLLEAAAGVAIREVEQVLALPEDRRGRSRTALSLALIAGNRLLATTFGDSSVAVISERAEPRGRTLSPAAAFLGSTRGSTPPVLTTDVGAGDWVVVASDGLTGFLGGDRWLERTADVLDETPAPEQAARRLIELAWAFGAGDHVAVALARVV